MRSFDHNLIASEQGSFSRSLTWSRLSKEVSSTIWRDLVWAGKLQRKSDVIEYMFDVIVNEVKKNSSNARKLEAGRDSLFEKRDVITISQIKTEPRRVKHAARFNLQRWMHVKPRLKQRKSQTEHVKLCPDLPRWNQKLPCFHLVLPIIVTSLVCLTFFVTLPPRLFGDANEF